MKRLNAGDVQTMTLEGKEKLCNWVAAEPPEGFYSELE